MAALPPQKPESRYSATGQSRAADAKNLTDRSRD